MVGIALIIARRAGRKSAIPFGPFMLAGAWIAILASDAIERLGVLP
jgi:leader peptidase (prepilin peptidase)/N-methyltransferase